MKKEFSRMAKAVSNQVADNYYMPDLKKAALARLCVVKKSPQGPERCGRVMELGFGTTASKVDAQIQSNERVTEIENQLQTQSERMRALEEKVGALLKLIGKNFF
ncbi:Ribosomal L28e domain-containing protein [Abeliophyllum distichum]|uniref:Ribosomal L28e domain-containing protein n=1 Tax=Abeliophyllum distichum TaxID=126358 RepID=A0ABD1TZV9_9LAMI